MNKKILFPAICFVIGLSTGFNLSDNETITNFKAYDGLISNSQIEFYDGMIKDVNTIEIYDTSDLTHEIMSNRNGKIIIEKIVGEVTNDSLDGKILNVNNNIESYINKGDGTYINYERVDGAKKGDKILTYYIYNPFSNEQDDVMTRLDFIIDNNAI